MPDATRQPITLAMMRELFYSAVVCDALDALGYPRQSPRVPLRPLTTPGVLIGRAKTTLWADMAHPDPRPYELELKAVDTCQPDDVLIAAAGGSMRSGLWGELLSTAARKGGNLRFAGPGDGAAEQRVTELLQLIVATREFQLV